MKCCAGARSGVVQVEDGAGQSEMGLPPPGSQAAAWLSALQHKAALSFVLLFYRSHLPSFQIRFSL